MTDITPILVLVIELLVALVSVFLVRWLNKNVGAEKTQEIMMWIKIAVQAAEQLFGAGRGEEKKEYVLNFLNSKGITYDSEKINAMIESQVYSLLNSERPQS